MELPSPTVSATPNTPLFCNNVIIQNEWVFNQQGDSMGPLLFSLTIWPIIQKIKTSVLSLLQHTWYLIDGFIAWSEDQINQTLEILANKVPAEKGLILRKDKYEQWSIEDLSSVDQAVKKNVGIGFEVLGGAVGSKEFVASCLKRVQKILSMLDNLHHLNDPQFALGILSYCLGTPKLVYSLRTNTPSNEMLEVLKRFETGQVKVLDQFVGPIIGDDARKLYFSPISLSGLGVKQSQEQFKGAFVSSNIASDELVNKITSRHPSESDTFEEVHHNLEPLNLLSQTQRKDPRST